MSLPSSHSAARLDALDVEHSQGAINEDSHETIPSSKETVEDLDEHNGAWLIVIGTWLVQFCTYGYVSAFGVYQDYYTRELLSDKTPSEISWIGSVQLFLQYALGVVVGRIYDLGYFRYLIGVGTTFQIVSLFMLSLTRPNHYPEVFLAQAIGMGLGQAMLFLPSISIVSHHFMTRRALATGVAVSGASMGGIIWPIILNQAIRRIDFPNAVRITAAILGTFLLVANFLYSIANPKLKSAQKASAHSPNFRLIFAFCINLGLFFPYFYLQSYALSKGIGASFAFYLLAILNAGSVFGRVLPNFLADKFGTYNMLLPSLYISSALVFAMFGIHNAAGLTIFALLYGFWSGAYVSLIPSLLVQLCSEPGELGIRMGIAFSIVAVSLLCGTPIEGLLLDAHKEPFKWSGPITFCGVCIRLYFSTLDSKHTTIRL
ncbi:Riboflavin transporter MCH5 [Leucoagaricus sp. SymC.cos]|nr:Riboflavin transporter MCH5 [Leucoagaricus sp. SymC.cos]